MKRLCVIAVMLLGACSTVQPSTTVQPSDPFAHLCPPRSSASCPGDTDTPVTLTGTPDSNVAVR